MLNDVSRRRRRAGPAEILPSPWRSRNGMATKPTKRRPKNLSGEGPRFGKHTNHRLSKETVANAERSR
jgi:hypothetical protein